MFQTLSQHLHRRASGDEGIAMIVVMGAISVMSVLLAATFAYAMAVEPQARQNQDWNGALAAAQAGVDDYVAKLNANDAYWQSVDCNNIALKGPNAGTNSCGWTSSTPVGWQYVNPSDHSAGQFHYDADSSVIYSQGAVRLTSTGKVNNVSRTIQVLVSRGGSTDFLYYTDFESADPANTYAYPNGAPNNDCGKSGPTLAQYYYTGRTSSDNCVEITFVSGDTLDGKVHFNDTPLMSGSPTFQQGYETADPNCQKTPYNVSNCRRGSGTPTFGAGATATWAPQLLLPDNANNFATFPGCQYTGDTRIKFNSDGTMTVWSTGSKGTSTGTNCGVFTGSSSVTVPVPTDQVIYVKNASAQSKCTAGQVGDGWPLTGDLNMDVPTFYCGTGNVYVEGTVKGRVTIASQNNIILTGNLLIDGVPAGSAPAGTSLVGLVAANSVVVAHPVKCTATKNGSCTSEANIQTGNTDRYIYASIQTLQHSFWVQAYNQGAFLGTLTVYGSIAQKWRGIVGTGGSGGTGYLKAYKYDTRLRFQSPPYFPQWVNAVWAGKTTGEIKPAY